MKRLITLTLVILLLACCVACGEGDITVSEGESSVGAEQSTESSKPWYETSVPESYSSEAVENSSQAESVPEESEPEVSDTSGEAELRNFKSDIPEKAAKGCKIVFTKNSPVYAEICNTAGTVCAIYDGAITRFFNAITGEYYCSEYGKWTEKCCRGFYNENRRLWIGFEFDKDYDTFVSSYKSDGHAHGYGLPFNFYLTTDQKTYVYTGDEGGYELYYGEGVFICCEWNSSDLSVFENQTFDTFSESVGRKYGLAENGRVIIPFEYDSIQTYNYDGVGVVVAVKDGKTYYFSTDGTNLTPEGFDCGAQPYENRAWVFKDGQGYIIEFYS